MHINFKNAPYFNAHIISGTTLINLCKLLKDNKYDVQWRFIPRLLLALPVIFLNMPFIFLEYLIYSRKIKKTIVKKPIFILGYPRSGTTYLMYLLSKDPRFAFSKTYQCMGPHVFFTFGNLLWLIAKMALPRKRPMDNLEFGADEPKEEEFALAGMGLESMANALYFPKQFSNYFNRFVLFNQSDEEKNNYIKNLSFLLKKLTLKNNGRQLLLKSPFNTGRVKMILEMYPDAKFIHIHRHPYSVYLSNEKLYESILPRVSFQTISNEAMEKHVFYTYRETMNAFFEDKKNLNDDQLFEMSYLDFIGNPEAILKKVYSQLKLEDFEAALPHIQKEIKHYSDYKVNLHKPDKVKMDRVYEQWKPIYQMLCYGKEI